MLSLPRALLAIIIGVALSLVLVWELTSPIKLQVSERYRQRGDVYLAGQDFDSAQSEYQKALHYNPENSLAQADLHLAKLGPTDPAQLRNFYAAHNQEAIVDKLDAATASFTTPKKALQAGVDLYNEGDYAVARYPVETATVMDPEYPEAWHYLGLIYDKLAGEDVSYRQKSLEAWQKRDALTDKYTSTENTSR